MIPNNSNTTNGCDSTSSNCVVWQGPDLTCVNVCTGDTISDIIAKLCNELLTITNGSHGSIDIATINQLCLVDKWGTANTIQELIQHIINQLCDCCENSGNTDPCSCQIATGCLQREATKLFGVHEGDIVQFLNLTDWASLISSVLCDTMDAITGLQTQINDLTIRVNILENPGGPAPGGPTLPIMRPRYVSNTKLKLDRMVVLTEEAVGELRQATGTPQDINGAIQYACTNLNTATRLNGSGTMSANRGWINSPANMAQSFRNMWITLCDTRSAVEDIQSTVSNPLCSSITYGVEGSTKRSGDAFSGIELDFSSSSIPSSYKDCNGRGTKIIITDSSLNSITKYVDVAGQYQDSGPYGISTGAMGNLDTSSNFSVRVEFCFASEDNQCAETQTFTIDNSTPCPTLNVGTVTAETIPYVLTDINLPTNKGHIINIDLKTRSGSILDTRVFSVYSSSITGTFANLSGHTQYNIGVRLSRTGSTEETTCPDTLVTTVAPICTSTSLGPSDPSWEIVTTNLQTGANTLTLAEYNSGISETKWQVGFNDLNQIIVTQAPTTGLTATQWTHSGSFINNQNPLAPITCDGITYGAPVTASNSDSGWKYVDTLKDPLGNMFFIYALIDSVAHTIVQIIACCNCSSIFLTIPQATYFARKAGITTVPVTVVGYTAGTGVSSWTIGAQPDHGTVSLNSGSTDSEATFTYTQDGTDFTFDSFTLSMTNNCGTTNLLNIPIVRTDRITNNDTDINIVIDTATWTIADANAIKTSWNAIKSELRSLAVNWTGTVNYIPSISTSTYSGDYLKHVKGMVENIGNITLPAKEAIDLPSVGVWYDWMSLPAYWDAAYTGGFPSSIHIISFVSKVDNSIPTATYATNSVMGTYPTAWASQPTTSGGGAIDKYQEDYLGIIDITSGTTPISTWGIAEVAKGAWASGTIPFVFTQTVINKISGGEPSTDSSMVAALQMASSITGPDFLTGREYAGMVIGGAVNRGYLNEYLLIGGATPNPYSAVNNVYGTESNSISPALYIESTTTWDVVTEPILKSYFYGMLALVEGSNVDTPNNPSAETMGGAAVYGASVTSAVAACNDGKVPATNIQIWNMSGTQFDVSQRAYIRQSGATNEQVGTSLELTKNTYYALSPGTTCTNCVAKYLGGLAGDVAPFWDTPGNCP